MNILNFKNINHVFDYYEYYSKTDFIINIKEAYNQSQMGNCPCQTKLKRNQTEKAQVESKEKEQQGEHFQNKEPQEEGGHDQPLEKWIFVKTMNKILQNVCPTSEQVDQFAKLAIDTYQRNHKFVTRCASNINFQSLQCQKCPPDQNRYSIALFVGFLSYTSLIKEYTKKYNKTEITKAQQSRIFNTFATHLRQQFYDGDEQFDNPVKYDDEHINQLVELECVQDIIQRAGSKFKYEYNELREQMKQIKHMLSKTFTKYFENFDDIGYDLDKKEQWQKMAQISRYACEYHEKGIYFLIVYFIRCIEQLQKRKKSIHKTQEKLQAIILELGEKYQPGSKLENIEKYNDAFEHLEFKEEFQKIFVLSPHNKKEQLEEIIVERARTSESLKPKFQKLIAQCCLMECLWSKTSLKLSPNNPNPKAIIRIQQKMLLKEQNPSHSLQETIEDTLSSQQNNYKNTIQSILEEKDEISFKISDMLRAKCIFSDMEDILIAVQNIKQFINDRISETPNQFRLIQIQNRFKLKNPISDITLKILIDEDIIAELQLTLQSNFALYNFAHKVYEFNRSKMFSKVKTMYNYYKEYHKEMVETINGHLQNQQAFDKVHADKIRQFFNLQNSQNNFSLMKSLKHKLIVREVNPHVQQSFLQKTERIQILINLVFHRVLENISTEVIKQARKWLRSHKKNSVLILNSLVISQLIKSFDPIQQINIIRKILNNVKPEKINFATYFEEEFGIKKKYTILFRYSLRAYLKYLDMQNYFDKNEEMRNQSIVKSVYGKCSEEMIYKYFQMGDLESKKECYDKAQKYFQKALKQLQRQQNQIQQIQTLKYIIMFKLLEISFKEEDPSEQSIQQLQEIQTYLKQNDPKKQYTYYPFACRLLQAQYILIYPKKLINKILFFKNSEKWTDFQKNYKKAKEMAKIYGIPYSGEFVNEVEYRIWKYELEAENSGKSREQILDVHMRRVLSEFGRYREWDEVYKILKEYRSQYKKLGLREVKLKKNNCSTSLYINQKEMKEQKWQFFLQINHQNILELVGERLEDEGCDYLSAAILPNLKSLFLDGNQITDLGCSKLSSGKWPYLQELSLQENEIKEKGCKYLANGEWPNLADLYLGDNPIVHHIQTQAILKKGFPNVSVHWQAQEDEAQAEN